MSAAVWTPLETPPPPAAARTPAAPPPPAARGWRAVTPGAWLVWGRGVACDSAEEGLCRCI